MERAIEDLSLQGEDEGLPMECLMDQGQIARVELSVVGAQVFDYKNN